MQDVVSDDTGDQVGDKIVDTAMSRVLYPADIFEHIIDRFDQRLSFSIKLCHIDASGSSSCSF